MTDLDLLEAIQKGSLWLKLGKLRALGFIKGPMPSHNLRITEDGVEEVRRLKEGTQDLLSK